MHSGQTTLGLDASPSACSSAAVSDWPEPGLGVGGAGGPAARSLKAGARGQAIPSDPSSSLGPSPPSTLLVPNGLAAPGASVDCPQAPGAILPAVAEPELPDDCLGGNDDSSASPASRGTNWGHFTPRAPQKPG